jgi:hypothetical protein
VKKDDLEEFGIIEDFQEFRASIRVAREDAKDVAARIISSDLPIGDILIEEIPIDDIIRIIFENKEKTQTESFPIDARLVGEGK